MTNKVKSEQYAPAKKGDPNYVSPYVSGVFAVFVIVTIAFIVIRSALGLPDF